MVEFVMIFALGALAATLVALAALPALDRRAQRLARRRLEAVFPTSIAEIAAERDHARAAIAVETRRSELKVEAASREKAADLAEIGRRDMAIHALNETIAQRDASVGAFESELASQRASLLEAKALLAETEEALVALRAAHADLAAQGEAGDRDRGALTAALGAAREQLATTQGLLKTSDEAQQALQRELRATQDIVSERRVTIASLDVRLEAALSEARAAAEAFEAQLRAKQQELDDARQAARLAQDEAHSRSLALARAEAELKRLAQPKPKRAAKPKPVNDDARQDPSAPKPKPAPRQSRLRRGASEIKEAAE